MQIPATLDGNFRLCSRPTAKPYCRKSEVRRALIRGPVRASAVPINPLLPLWQQSAVQQAALKAFAAAGASFIAANALSTLVGKVANKVRKHAKSSFSIMHILQMPFGNVCPEELAIQDV